MSNSKKKRKATRRKRMENAANTAYEYYQKMLSDVIINAQTPKQESISTPPKKSNIAEVHVQELENGKFKVVALKNFLSVKELHDKYGSKAVALYGFPYMYKVSDTTIAAKSRSALLRLCIGDIISLRTFNEALTLMRSCGENLINAVKKAKEPETKPVKIFKI